MLAVLTLCQSYASMSFAMSWIVHHQSLGDADAAHPLRGDLKLWVHQQGACPDWLQVFQAWGAVLRFGVYFLIISPAFTSSTARSCQAWLDGRPPH